MLIPRFHYNFTNLTLFNSLCQHVTQTLLLSTGSTEIDYTKNHYTQQYLHKTALTSPRHQPLRPHTHSWNRTQEHPHLYNSCPIRHTRKGTPHTLPNASIPDAKKGSSQSDRNHLRMLHMLYICYDPLYSLICTLSYYVTCVYHCYVIGALYFVIYIYVWIYVL